MHALVGDRLVVHSPNVDGPVREGKITEVRGTEGAPPYVVRWTNDDHESLCFPGPDATVEHPGD